eukprot:CAMPEP_0170731080 /NCGR_PEP_ID=MMETSP0437-20130122/861_1 /TAXON_ID=0 /ORGANISM="Sexangularia sp." /LENGTH=79 /DNA_ID=CAMNT_0011069293 /DNA_START=178 /DNA_END=417 /DNA_ORIENTATION=+
MSQVTSKSSRVGPIGTGEHVPALKHPSVFVGQGTSDSPLVMHSSSPGRVDFPATHLSSLRHAMSPHSYLSSSGSDKMEQ